MRGTILPFILLVFLIASCKKESNENTPTSTPPPPPLPPVGVNSVTLSTCLVNNLTILRPSTYNYLPSGWLTSPLYTDIVIGYTDSIFAFPGLNVKTRLTGLGTDTFPPSFSNLVSSVRFSIDSSYSCATFPSNQVDYDWDVNTYVPGNFLTISRYDTVGGRIEGTFHFKLIELFTTLDTIVIDGQFSVKRFQ
jgi:hypothetical protein